MAVSSCTIAAVSKNGKPVMLDRSVLDRWMAAIGDGVELEITVAERKDSRSLRQNRTYWSQIIAPLAEHLGYDHDEREDLHEGLLAEFGGTHVDKATGRAVPNKRSSKMNVQDFGEYMDFCVRWAAKLPSPLVLELPNDRSDA